MGPNKETVAITRHELWWWNEWARLGLRSRATNLTQLDAARLLAALTAAEGLRDRLRARHSEFNHDYERDEATCPDCQALAAFDARVER